MATKTIATSAKLKIGSSTYDVRSIPCGIAESADPADVTVCSDVEQRFVAAAVTEDGEFSVEVADTPPQVNATGATSLELVKRAGSATPAAAAVSCGNCIVTGVEPATIEVGGNRVLTWTVTIRPDGSRS